MSTYGHRRALHSFPTRRSSDLQFDLTDDQREIQELARRFTADAITPHAAEWDEKHIFPRDTIRAAAELGFGSIYVSDRKSTRLNSSHSQISYAVFCLKKKKK